MTITEKTDELEARSVRIGKELDELVIRVNEIEIPSVEDLDKSLSQIWYTGFRWGVAVGVLLGSIGMAWMA